MLIDFTVNNFASFKDTTILSAETGSRLRKFKEKNTFQTKSPNLLKSLFLFGPNGSGKSQLIRALGTMQELVLHSTQTVTDELAYNPFLFNEDSKKQDTYFAVTIELNNVIYKYSFSYNQQRINQEALTKIENKREIVLFSRKKDKVEIYNELLKSSIPKLRDNELLLYLAQSENDPDSGAVFKWFARDLMFIHDKIIIPSSMLNLMQNEHLKKEMISFLNFADFNITDIKIRDIEINGQKQKYLFTVHTIYDGDKVVSSGELPLGAESLGTQRLFYIVLALMSAQTNGNQKTIIIDEFDISLHVELATALVHIFNSKENLNQFIIATHDIQLLDADLRIDQIYLIDKDFHGISNLKSIFDFEDARNKGRRDISFAKRYLQGTFGAVPVIDVNGLLGVLDTIHEKYGVDDEQK